VPICAAKLVVPLTGFWEAHQIGTDKSASVELFQDTGFGSKYSNFPRCPQVPLEEAWATFLERRFSITSSHSKPSTSCCFTTHSLEIANILHDINIMGYHQAPE
jgi:hypothetical protein